LFQQNIQNLKVPPPPYLASAALQPGQTIDRYKIVRILRTSKKSKAIMPSSHQKRASIIHYLLKQVLDPAAFLHEVSCASKIQKQRSNVFVCYKVLAIVRSRREFHRDRDGSRATNGRAVARKLRVATARSALEDRSRPIQRNRVSAHQSGLIHCDLKLSNLVWLDGPKKSKLVDIGAAQKADQGSRKKCPGVFCCPFWGEGVRYWGPASTKHINYFEEDCGSVDCERAGYIDGTAQPHSLQHILLVAGQNSLRRACGAAAARAQRR
jgi:serine/threonine protein kinase